MTVEKLILKLGNGAMLRRLHYSGQENFELYENSKATTQVEWKVYHQMRNQG